MNAIIHPAPPEARAQQVAAHIDLAIGRFIDLRRDLHQHPELAFQERRTAGVVAEHLASWGYQVTTGLAGTGVVGSLRRGSSSRSLGLRADMDALPVREATGRDYASENAGVMHACGHDGHTTILLAAARTLAEAGQFDGTLHVIFQPAEETGGGAERLLAAGLFERFPCDAIFGLHNWPGLPEGRFGFVEGPAMAAVDQLLVTIHGRGGHGAAPHETVDPVVAAAHLITALQTVVSRNVDPLDAAVVTVGSIHGGSASNIIPETVDLRATVRCFGTSVRDLLEARIPKLLHAQAESFGARLDLQYNRGYPAVQNAPAETEIARSVAATAFGDDSLLPDLRPRTASEDFAFYLQARPGCFLFLGSGDGPSLHSASYDFNDALIRPAATYWVRLAETFLS